MAQGKDKKFSIVSQKEEEKEKEKELKEGEVSENNETDEQVNNEIDKMQEQLASLEEKIKELEEENSSLKNQYLRKQADFENFRKRMQREKEDAIHYANSNLLLDIVTIIDDFERAIKAGEDAQDLESFKKGIELIEKQFTGMLERKWGLARFDSVGEEFDPEKHEAIATEETDHDTSVVIDDYQKGYYLHDRVLRPAKVRVSMPASKNNNQTARENTNGETEESERGEE